MISPLTSIIVEANEFGSELDIFWQLPIASLLPTNYQVFLFQRSTSDVSQSDIDSYFSNINNLTNYNYNGLMVWDQLTNNAINAMSVVQVINGLTYFFRGVIRNQDTGEYSLSVGASAVPASIILVNILDGKDIVAKTIEKMFDSVTDKKGRKIQKSKDIEIIKNYAMTPLNKDTVMIDRINGSSEARFWGNILHKVQQSYIIGDIDTDVIRVTFLTEAGGERRDTITNIFRAKKQFLYHMIKTLGAFDVSITIEGDYYNPQLHGINALGITVVFAMMIENKSRITEEIITQHIMNDQNEVNNG